MDKFLVSHNTLEDIRTALRDESTPLPTHFKSLYGIPIEAMPHLPDRDMRDVWSPPAGDRFFSYGPEDESWMRPLGIGTIRQVDFGPLILKINTEMIDKLFTELFTGPSPMESVFSSFGVNEKLIACATHNFSLGAMHNFILNGCV